MAGGLPAAAAEAFRTATRAPTALQAAEGHPSRKLPGAAHLQKQRFAVTRIAATVRGKEEVNGKRRENELGAEDYEAEKDPIQHARTIGEEPEKIPKDTRSRVWRATRAALLRSAFVPTLLFRPRDPVRYWNKRSSGGCNKVHRIRRLLPERPLFGREKIRWTTGCG